MLEQQLVVRQQLSHLSRVATPVELAHALKHLFMQELHALSLRSLIQLILRPVAQQCCVQQGSK
jgi:hypothetical protein